MRPEFSPTRLVSPLVARSSPKENSPMTEEEPKEISYDGALKIRALIKQALELGYTPINNEHIYEIITWVGLGGLVHKRHKMAQHLDTLDVQQLLEIAA